MSTEAPDLRDEADRLLRGVLSGLRAGLSIIGSDFRVLRSDGEPSGRACYEETFGLEEPCPFCHAKEVVATRTPSRTVNEVADGRGGNRWVELLTVPMFGEGGEVSFVIELTRDVTREKELETRLRETEKLAAVGRLAAGIAHEIRNPLGIIHASVDVLANRDRPDAQRDEAAEILRCEVSRLSAIVTDFLTYANPTPPALHAVDLATLAARVVEELATGRPRLEVHAAPDLPRREVDPDRLRQVVLNLVLNAVEAAGPDGRVDVRLERTGDGRVALVVRDDGPGLAAETRERIFEPFFTTKPRGTGLGLAIVRGIVDAHGGEVTAADRPEGGAELRVVV